MDSSRERTSGPNDTRLEGWCEIADHLGVCQRTARRWEKDEPAIPIHRELANKRPYAWSGDLDLWRNQDSESTPTVATGPTENSDGLSPTQRRTWGRPALLLVLGLLCFFLWQMWGTHSQPNSFLHYEIKSRGTGSIIYLQDENNATALTLTDPNQDWSKNRFPFPKPPTLCLADLNRDGRDDAVYAPQLPKGDTVVQVFYQKPNHSCTLKTSWFTPNQMIYQDETFQGFQPRWLDCEDLTGDGIPEIILIQVQHDFYPSFCLVYDRAGNLLFELRHPGRLINTFVMDWNGNGTPELYVAGTNNFIAEGEFSAPVLLVIERPWQRKAVVNLFGPNRTLADEVPADTKLCYLNFKKDHVSGMVADWEAAYLGNRRGSSELALNVGQLVPPSQGFLRLFRLAPDLRCSLGFTPADLARRLDVDQKALSAAGLYTAIYWNGLAWQEDVCYLPRVAQGLL